MHDLWHFPFSSQLLHIHVKTFIYIYLYLEKENFTRLDFFATVVTHQSNCKYFVGLASSVES